MLASIFWNSFWRDYFARSAHRHRATQEEWVEGTISSTCNTGSDWHVTIEVTSTDDPPQQRFLHIWWGGLDLPAPEAGTLVHICPRKPLGVFLRGLRYKGHTLYYESLEEIARQQHRRYEHCQRMRHKPARLESGQMI